MSVHVDLPCCFMAGRIGYAHLWYRIPEGLSKISLPPQLPSFPPQGHPLLPLFLDIHREVSVPLLVNKCTLPPIFAV